MITNDIMDSAGLGRSLRTPSLEVTNYLTRDWEAQKDRRPLPTYGRSAARLWL